MKSLLTLVGILQLLLTFHPNGALAGRADWMKGKHGIGYRVPAGAGMQSSIYDPVAFANQIKDTSISWVVVNLSSGAFGTTYMAPHSVLTDLNPGSTPKQFNLVDMMDWWMNYYNKNLDLHSYDDRDVMDEIITAMDDIDVKVIAYMAAQGPSMLKQGEEKAYDFNNNSPYVDSCVLCQAYGIFDCKCAPSVRKWNAWVKENYGSDDDETLKIAYAEVIVREYAEHYGTRLAGFWFDQGASANATAIVEAIRGNSTHPINPNAVIGYNNGGKSPLGNFNVGIEDYTSGHMTPLRDMNPQDGCYNYGMILSAENSNDGYVSDVFTGDGVSPTGFNYDSMSDPNTRLGLGDWGYANNSNPSLAHVFMPLAERWNSGDIVFGVKQAQEWQARVMRAGGAWTWNVPRCGCGGCTCANHNEAKVDDDDWAFLLEVYKGIDGGEAPVQEPYQYDDSNCQCCSPKTSTPGLQWGCLSSDAYPNLACNKDLGLEDIPTLATYAPTVSPEVPCANDKLYVHELPTLPGNYKFCDKTPQCPDCLGFGWLSSSRHNQARCSKTFYKVTEQNFYQFTSDGSPAVSGFEACPETCGCCNPPGSRPTSCPPATPPPPPETDVPSDAPSQTPTETQDLVTYPSNSSVTFPGFLTQAQVNATCEVIQYTLSGKCLTISGCKEIDVKNCSATVHEGQSRRNLQETNTTEIVAVSEMVVKQIEATESVQSFVESIDDTDSFNTLLDLYPVLENIAPFAVFSAFVPIDGNFHVSFVENSIEAVFDDVSATQELRFQYNISAKGASVSTRNSDCSVDITSVQANPPTREEGFPVGFYEYLNVGVDIKPDLLSNDAGVYTYDEATQKGTIIFCLRVDMYTYEDIEYTTSVNFHETIVTISLDLSQGFALEDVSTSRTEALNEQQNATVDYDLRSWKCDSEWNEDNSPVSQGSSVWICLETTSTSVNIQELLSLALTQEDAGEVGGYTYDPINSGVAGIVAQEPKRIMIRSFVVSGFFNVGNTNPINVTGSILWDFVTERRLASSDREETTSISNYSHNHQHQGRLLQKQESSGEFRLTLDLTSADAVGGGAATSETVIPRPNFVRNSGWIFSGIAVGLAMTFVVASLVAYRLAKRIDEQKLQCQEMKESTQTSTSSATNSSSSNPLKEEDALEKKTQRLHLV